MREAGVEGAGQDTKGKDCKMKNYFVCFILFLSGMFCACNHPEETAERLTAEPVVTEKIVQEETKIPIEKVESKAEFYPSREKWEQASADRRFWQ